MHSDNKNVKPAPAKSPDSKPSTPPRDILSEVVSKIQSSESILVALSKDPSVDELASAIALTMALDKMGKHGTAIFSGKIPGSIDFLQPDKTLEDNTNSLQDFIITLNKEKADHLRYKIEGDFVKIYITPYRTQLTEKDLEFSRGEYNVNLVISLDVASADELDSALSEHGRIMHDATSINITVSPPGKFGDLEWSDPSASSICEIVTVLLATLKENDESLVDPTIATALLAGMMSATDRFGNERTTPTTMTIASKLMEIGADQRLISANIGTTPVDPPKESSIKEKSSSSDQTKLTVRHGKEELKAKESTKAEPSEAEKAEQELEKVVEPLRPPAIGPVGSLMDELASQAPVRSTKDYSSLIEKELDDPLPYEIPPSEPEIPAENPAATIAPEAPSAVDPNHVPAMSYNTAPSDEAQVGSPSMGDSYIVNKPKTVLQPLSKEDSAVLIDNPTPPPEPALVPEPITEPASAAVPETPPEPTPESTPSPLPMPSPSEPLPPPPPPFDLNNSGLSLPPVQNPESPAPATAPIVPAAPPAKPDPGHPGEQPAMQDQVYASAVNDPASFRLPGR